jgi:hypothetical protein
MRAAPIGAPVGLRDIVPRREHVARIALVALRPQMPVGARACIREAGLVVRPSGVYSTFPAPVEIVRTTTSPGFAACARPGDALIDLPAVGRDKSSPKLEGSIQ